MTHRDERDDGCAGGSLFVGVVLMIVGAAFLVEQVTHHGVDGRFWPFILLALGAVKFATASRSARVPRSRRPGAWLLFIGVWGLVNEFHLLGLDYSTSWPLMIIGSGLMIVWRAFEGPDAGACVRARQEP